MRWKLALLLSCVLTAFPLAAQKITGTLQGVVTDESGAVVRGAKVTIIDKATSASREVTSNSTGEYIANDLPPSVYEIRVKAASFNESVVENVELHVSSSFVANIKMVVGAASESVTVEANAIQVETTSGTVGNVVDGTHVRELPLNGRSFVQLTQLMPGVSAAANFDSKHKGLEAGVDFSVNGNNTTNNLFLVDGANNNDVGSNRTILIYPSVDAIAEVKILRNSYGPEYGQAAGGVISITTRGGGNQLHGGVYYFGRNDSLNATEFFAARLGKKDVLRRNDFGYNLSGPIKKDKAFFFWNEEWNREKRGQTRLAKVPSAAIRTGDFSNLRANGCDGTQPTFPDGTPNGTHNIAASSLSLSPAGLLIAQQFPLPNIANPKDCNNWGQSLASTINWRQENARVDFNLNHANSLLVRYTQDSWVNPAPNSLGLWGDDIYPSIESNWTQPSRNAAVKLSTQIGSTGVNDFQFSYGYNAITATRGGTNPGLAAQITAAVPSYYPASGKSGGTQLAPPVFWGGISPYNSDTLWTLAPWHNNEALYSVRDDLSKVKGDHTLKIGFLFSKNAKNELSGGTSESEAPAFWGPPATRQDPNFPTDPTKTIKNDYGNGLANVLLRDTSYGFGETQRAPFAQVRWHDVELYVGDNWKARRNLTVEYGVRWSLLAQPTNATNQIASFVPSAYDPNRNDSCNGLLVVPGAKYCQAAGFLPGVNGPNDALKKNNYHAFAPRLGVAWDPRSDGKMSIRAGLGQFYQRERLNGPLNRVVNPPFALAASDYRALDTAPATGSLAAAGSPSVGIDPGSALPNSWQYNLTVERELWKDTKFELAYVGNRGVNLVRFADINEVPLADRLAFANTNSSALRPFGKGGFGKISYEVWNGKSNYNSLQTLFRTKIRRMDAQFAYTWSKNLANSDITSSGGLDNNSGISDLSNPNLDYGPTLINRPHVFTANVIYNAPDFKDKNMFSRSVLGGWEMASILNYSSGPSETFYWGGFNAVSGGLTGTGFNDNTRPIRVASVPCRASGGPKEQIFNPGAFTLNGYKVGTVSGSSRGICEGPGLAQTDFSIYKNFKVGEHVKAQLRLEFFNAFNKTQFRADKINFFLGNGGGSAPKPPPGGVQTAVWNAATDEQSSFGQSTLTKGPREIQYALKFTF